MRRMRRMRCLIAASLITALWLAGCSDDDGTGGQPDASVIADSAPGIDGAKQPDGGPVTDGTAPGLDQKIADAGPGAALTAVANQLILPAAAEDYAVDYDGTGPKNQFGAINGAMALFGFMDLQAEMDSMVDSGQILLLFEVFGDSIVDAASVTIQVNLGEDLDGDPSNNFSGSEELGISANSPSDLILDGQISAGALTTTPGDLAIAVPFPGSGAVVVSLKKARVSGDLSDSMEAITDGVIAGAIPEEDMDTNILPVIADLITNLWQDPNTDDLIKGILGSMDTNTDGVIDVDEIKSNDMFGMFIAPDVDTDGDGTNDAMSFGMGFSAVPCTIKKGL